MSVPGTNVASKPLERDLAPNRRVSRAASTREPIAPSRGAAAALASGGGAADGPELDDAVPRRARARGRRSRPSAASPPARGASRRDRRRSLSVVGPALLADPPVPDVHDPVGDLGRGGSWLTTRAVAPSSRASSASRSSTSAAVTASSSPVGSSATSSAGDGRARRRARSAAARRRRARAAARPRDRGGRRARAARARATRASARVAPREPERQRDELDGRQLVGERAPVVLVGVADRRRRGTARAADGRRAERRARRRPRASRATGARGRRPPARASTSRSRSARARRRARPARRRASGPAARRRRRPPRGRRGRRPAGRRARHASPPIRPRAARVGERAPRRERDEAAAAAAK